MSKKNYKSNFKKRNKNFSSTQNNVIHGSNYNEYLYDLDNKLKSELIRRSKECGRNVLDYSIDDAGNADFFLDITEGYVKFNTDKNCYQYWNGYYWLDDKTETIYRWIQCAMRFRREYTLKAIKNSKTYNISNDCRQHALRCCNQHSIKAAYELSKSLLSCKDHIFDTKKYLLNVLNGTIDLRTGKLKKHDPEDYITKMIPFMYDEKAESKRFDKFLIDTFADNELIEYIQRLQGYCTTGETTEQVLHFFVGTGANGKSTYLSLFRHVLNDYATVIPSKVLTTLEKAGSASSEIAQLPHKRLVCCSELNCTDVLNEGKIKIISSGETLSARQLYSPSFTFEPEFKCIIDTNYLPQITGTDYGIWRRIRVVPFEHTVSKDKINKNLLDELKADSKAVLAWLVKGAVKYYRYGLGSCDAVEKATKKYRKTQDTLGSFIDACIKDSKGSSIRARDLYNKYTLYCSDNLLTPMSETKFGKDFAARGYKRAKDKVSRKYIDIKFND